MTQTHADDNSEECENFVRQTRAIIMDRLSAMRLFVRIGQLNSFARAAESLGISSAAATERIRRLEAEVNAKLLNRTTRRVALTEEGERYWKVCQSVLDELEEVERSIGEVRRERRGRVTISVNVGIFRAILLPRLASFVEAHPEIRLQIITTDQRADFVREGVDFAIRMGGLEDQDLMLRAIGAPMRVTVAAPDYIRQHGRPQTPNDIHHHRAIDFLLPRAGRVLDWEFASGGDVAEVQFGGPVALNDAEARVRLAEDGLGVVQTVCFLAAPQIASGRLERLLREWETEAPTISLLYPRSKYLPARVRAAMDFCAEAISTTLQQARTALEPTCAV
jgi:LysR family transcriptional regulator for bpeEF and oprC